MIRRRNYYFLMAAVLMLCCLMYVMTAPTVIYDYGPDWSPQGQVIAFICNRPIPDFKIYDPPRDGDIPFPPQNSEICIVAPDGSRRAYLTDNKVKDSDPRFSPDGNFIAFTRKQEQTPFLTYLYLMNSDGSQQRQVSSAGGVRRLMWSLDSTMIAFVTNDLYVVDLVSKVERRLMPAPFDHFTWSPDSQRIAFVLEMRDQCELHIVTVDAGRETVSPIQTGCEDIAWSPNGKYLAFSGQQASSFEGSYRFALNLDTEQIITLTHKRQSRGGGFVWSSDSERVYYLAEREMFIARIDGAGATQLTHSGGALLGYFGLQNLALSPDGKQLVFSRVESGSRQDIARLWKINTDGSGLQQLSP